MTLSKKCSKCIVEKREEKCDFLEKYGVEHAIQNPDILIKRLGGQDGTT